MMNSVQRTTQSLPFILLFCIYLDSTLRFSGHLFQVNLG